MGCTRIMQIARAEHHDIDDYVRLAQDAQAFVRSLGLTQWVPAAHEPYRAHLRAAVESGSLYKALLLDAAVGFFSYSCESSWWADHTDAAYVSGIVVSRRIAGQKVGKAILDWCRNTAIAAGLKQLRLDCHADNERLLRYYVDYGFSEVSRVEQHPNYVGALMELELEAPSSNHREN